MNKKIIAVSAIAVIAIAIAVVGLKTTLGDKAAELPGEEGTEKTLNLQENNNSSSNSTGSGESSTSESSESGP